MAAHSLVEATQAYYHPGRWTIKEIRSELIMQGMKKAQAEREIAAQLGLSKRTIERYIVEQEGSGKQARGKKSLAQREKQINALGNRLIGPKPVAAIGKPQGAVRQKGGKLVAAKPKAAAGIHVQLDGIIGVNGEGEDYERDRTIDLSLDEREWAALVSLAQEHGEAAALGLLAEVYEVESIYLATGEVYVF